LQEDGLRLLRAARFIVTKGFLPDEDLKHVLETSTWWSWLEETVSTERIREELHKMFVHDTAAAMKFLVWNCSANAVRKLFDDDIWLKPTMEKK
jgi:tRNA nucleotidyltransferase/poly(A) polymerase